MALVLRLGRQGGTNSFGRFASRSGTTAAAASSSTLPEPTNQARDLALADGAD